MKIALIGDGKTGSKLKELLSDSNISYTIFNIDNPPQESSLVGHDAIISFLPGDIFQQQIPLLLKSQIPVITGSTGFEWPTNINQMIQDANTTWIHASNFSLGMRLIHKMISVLSNTDKLFNDFSFDIHEVHHTQKVDAPSGTALSWEKWSGNKCNVTSERIGDTVGIHQLKLKTQNEEIVLEHKALDRKIFAEGALWATKKLLTSDGFEKRLYNFEEITNLEIK